MVDLPIVYEDKFLLVVNKPPFLVSVQTKISKEPTLASILEQKFRLGLQRGGLVHRLDKDTSGLLIVAKDGKTLEKMQEQFKNRKVKKEYFALVHGWMKEEQVVRLGIERNPKMHDKFTVSEEGRDSITEFEPLGLKQMSTQQILTIFSDLSKTQVHKLEQMSYSRFSLLSCRPQTGRTHQIRVHLKYINFPIVSDEKYVGRRVNKLDKKWCPRLFLHASKLEFDHPQGGDRVVLRADLPEDLADALSKLEDYEISV